MYKGNNPIALRSQRMIRNSFLELLKVKSYDSISITEITKNADLARQTFYLVFKSKEEIIEFHLDEMFKKLINELKKKEKINVKLLIEMSFDFFQKNMYLYKVLFQNGLTSILVKKHKEFIYTSRKLIYSGDAKHEEYALAFLAGALVELQSTWVNNNNNNISMKELSNLIYDILAGNYFILEQIDTDMK